MSPAEESRRSQLLACIISLLLLPSLGICLRIAARRITKAGFVLDDWLIIGALISHWGMGACIFSAYKLGLGAHQPIKSSVNDQVSFAKIIWSLEFIYQVTICLYKLSILSGYYRIFGIKKNRLPLHITSSVLIIYTIWSNLQTLLQCLPIAANWRVPSNLYPEDRCIDPRTHLLSLAITNVLLDWTLLLLPLPFVFSLTMSIVRKCEVALLMILGTMVVIFSLIRVVSITTWSHTDVTWNYVSLVEWSIAETAMGILCPCLVTLRPVLRRVFGKFYDSAAVTSAVAGTVTQQQTSFTDALRGRSVRMNRSNSDANSAVIGRYADDEADRFK